MTEADPWVSGFYRRLASPPALLVVLSGPSGAGKDATLRRMQEMGYPFHFVVTTTSRPPRSGEVEGVDYNFVSTAQFEAMIRRGEMLEHALVYGEYKGIPRRQVEAALQSGKDVIMRLDVQGASTMRRLASEALLIFLTVPSEEELVARLRSRQTEDEEALRRRVATAQQELHQVEAFDYVVVNREGCLDEAVRQVRAIIQAERCRVRPRQVIAQLLALGEGREG